MKRLVRKLLRIILAILSVFVLCVSSITSTSAYTIDQNGPFDSSRDQHWIDEHNTHKYWVSIFMQYSSSYVNDNNVEGNKYQYVFSWNFWSDEKEFSFALGDYSRVDSNLSNYVRESLDVVDTNNKFCSFPVSSYMYSFNTVNGGEPYQKYFTRHSTSGDSTQMPFDITGNVILTPSGIENFISNVSTLGFYQLSDWKLEFYSNFNPKIFVGDKKYDITIGLPNYDFKVDFLYNKHVSYSPDSTQYLMKGDNQKFKIYIEDGYALEKVLLNDEELKDYEILKDEEGKRYIEHTIKDIQKDYIVSVEVKDDTKGFFETIIDAIIGLPQLFIDGLVSLFDTVVNAILSLVDLLLDGLKALFIPEDDYFSNYFDELYDFFSEKLGILFYPFDLLIRLVNYYLNIGKGSGMIYIPDININGWHIINSMSFDLQDTMSIALGSWYDLYYAFVDCVLVIALVNYARKMFDEVVGGHSNG